MATTPNYGWVTPAPTDFVTDLPADFEVFADAVDDTVKDLNPGTTAGDLDYYTSSTTKARLAIGTAGQILAVNSGATAPEWVAAGAADNFSLINAGGTALTGASTITISGISNKNRLLIYVDGASSANASIGFRVQFNSDSANNYTFAAITNSAGSIASSITTDNYVTVALKGNSAADVMTLLMSLDGTNATGFKPFNWTSNASGSSTNQSRTGNGFYKGTSAISSVSLISSSGNWDAGTAYIYGA